MIINNFYFGSLAIYEIKTNPILIVNANTIEFKSRPTKLTKIFFVAAFLKKLQLNWSERRDSNSRHSAWKADALPTELLSHKCW